MEFGSAEEQPYKCQNNNRTEKRKRRCHQKTSFLIFFFGAKKTKKNLHPNWLANLTNLKQILTKKMVNVF
jgi:hypothetical protein